MDVWTDLETRCTCEVYLFRDGVWDWHRCDEKAVCVVGGEAICGMHKEARSNESLEGTDQPEGMEWDGKPTIEDGADM